MAHEFTNLQTEVDVKFEDANEPVNPYSKRELRWSYLRQILCSIVISSGLYVIAFLIGSTSMLPAILNTNLTLSNYTAEDLKWLASGPILMTIPGNFLAVILTEKFGPTIVFRGSLFLCFIFYAIKALYPTLSVVWVSRTFLWILIGMFDIICVPLIALLSEPSVRGLCGALPEFTTSLGMLMVFISFSFLNGTNAILCNAIPVFLGFLGSMFLPESPYWLIQRGRYSEACKSLQRTIGPSRSEKQKEIFQEMLSRLKIQDGVKEIKQNPSMVAQFKLLKEPKNWKPVLLAITIFAFREFGGNNIIFFYALTIFEASEISVNIFLCTIVVGVTRVLSTLISANFQDKFGRRVILIGSTAISAISLLISGFVLFFNFQVLKIVPLIGIIIFILMVGVGMGPVPFIILGEVVPSDIKFLGTAIVYSLFNLYQFALVNVMPKFLQLFSVGTIFITFSIINFGISVIIYFILPETRCKTFTEIENMFK